MQNSVFYYASIRLLSCHSVCLPSCICSHRLPTPHLSLCLLLPHLCSPRVSSQKKAKDVQSRSLRWVSSSQTKKKENPDVEDTETQVWVCLLSNCRAVLFIFSPETERVVVPSRTPSIMLRFSPLSARSPPPAVRTPTQHMSPCVPLWRGAEHLTRLARLIWLVWGVFAYCGYVHLHAWAAAAGGVRINLHVCSK